MEGEQVEGGGTPAAETGGGKTIPYERFQAMVSARDQALAEAQASKARVADLESVGSELTSLQAQLAARSTDLRLADLGMTSDEGRDIARALHARLPESERPALADWFEVAGREHPALSGYLPPASPTAPAAPPATPPAEAPPAEAPAVPRSNQGARPTTPDSPVTPSQLEEATRRVGRDPSEKNREHLRNLVARFKGGQ